MKNFEFYEEELLKTAADESSVAVIKGKPVPCTCITCEGCDFNGVDNDCGASLIKWLYAEHVEKPKISKRTRMFFEAIETGWVARDKDGTLTIYTDKPIKNTGCNWWSRCISGEYIYVDRWFFGFISLDFIRWEDEEPWRVEDILKLEVEE